MPDERQYQADMTSHQPTRPVLRLKPKTDARKIRHGSPWVFDNEVVLDRRTKAIQPGSLAVLEDNGREALGLVAINPQSRIVGRMIDRDPAAHIDVDWFNSRLKKALKLRESVYRTPHYRLVHAEADALPGVVIDRFDNIVVVQPNAAWAEQYLDVLVEALRGLGGVDTIYKNASGRARALEGLDDASVCLVGQMPDHPVKVPMNNAVYLADLTGGQKTGLFFDQRENHASVARFVKGARVLDVFSHVGGFALAALAGGAEKALCVDGSDPALQLAKAGAGEMGKSDRLGIRRGDAFDTMEALANEGEKFDVVICDPPAFVPAKPALEKGLRAYERVARLAAKLVAQDGILALCSCSHAADLSRFRGACIRGIGRAGRQAQLLHTGFAGPDHPMLPQLAETGYLKALIFRL